MKIADKLIKVNEYISINRYDNGYMVEVSGRTVAEDYGTVKILVEDSSGVKQLIDEYNAMPIDS